jgi:hypothetical protein
LSRYQRGGEIRRGIPRPPVQRQGNRVFYVVAEGQGTEYDYLGHLNVNYGADLKFLIRYPSQRRGLSPAQVIDKACDAAGEPGVSIWGLFDHDGRPDIDQACARADQQGIGVALSHPAFELWLLLHFQDFATAQGGSEQRDYGKASCCSSGVRELPRAASV